MVDWPQIVKEHGPLVWQAAYRILRQEADAADCFQNTFVAVLEVSRRQTIRHWPALLKRVATMQALNRLAQRGREKRRAQPLEADGDTSREATPEQSAHQSELSERLEAALAEIGPREANVFWLACLEGWSYQEIAEELKISTNHVGVLLHRARTELRSRLRSFDPSNKHEPTPGTPS